MFAFQLVFNNSFNAFIEIYSNEIVYEFKVREIIHAITIFFLSKNINVDTKRQLKNIEAMPFRYRIEVTNVIFYVNAQSKIQYDVKHVLLLFQLDDKIYFRLHYDYTLFNKSNHKLSKQRCDLFKVKRHVDRLAYELNFSFQWKIHSIVFVTQLKSYSKNNFYKSSKSNYSNEVEIIDQFNTTWEKNYEIKRLINRRYRTFERITITQYLMRWKEYDFEYDEWIS